MSWLWGGSSAPAPKPAPKKSEPEPKPEEECPPGGNLSLAPKLRHARADYSGFVSRYMEGYFGPAPEKRWVELTGEQTARELRIMTAGGPLKGESAVRTLPMKGAQAFPVNKEGAEDVYELAVQGCYDGTYWAERFYVSSAEEREQWCMRVCLAALQGDEEVKMEKPDEQNPRWISMMERGPKAFIPTLDPAIIPEKQDTPLMQGYLTCRHESESMVGAVLGLGGSDWKRRWVTVHNSFISVRDDRAAATGWKLFPMRDTGAEWGTIAGHPWSFVLSGPYFSDLTLSFDSKEKYSEWRKEVMLAALNTSPRSVEESGPVDVDALLAQEILEIEQELES